MAKLGNLASRVLVAAVAIPIIVLLVYLDEPAYLWGVITLASAVALHEFYAMTLEDKTDQLVSLALALVAVCLFYWLRPSHKRMYGHALAVFAGVVPVAFYYLMRFGDQATVASRMAYSIAGVFYVGIAAQFLALIKRDLDGDVVVIVLTIAWVGDSAAYFAGRFLGKRKLYEAVSPKKTIAGAIGGVGGAIAAAAFGVFVLVNDGSVSGPLAWYDVLLLAIPGAVLGQGGDLVESLIKRSTGVKDSGSLLPGHGGLLDRIDAVLFIAPYVYLYLQVRADLV